MLSALKSVYQEALASLPVAHRRRVMYLRMHRRPLHLSDPQTFSEKVNWRMLNDRRDLIRNSCDKLWMKDLARNSGVAVPETLWSGTDVHNITGVSGDWVLKPNHRSGLVHFGSGTPDPDEIARVTAGWLDETNATALGEWAYSQARRLLIIEELLGQRGEDLPDYKFFVFNGKVQMIQVDTSRHTTHQRRLYTPSWRPMDTKMHYPLGPISPAPEALDEMIEIASRVGKPFDFIRVDLYVVDSRIYLGEVTPYPDGGLARFESADNDIDTNLGSMWVLPRL